MSIEGMIQTSPKNKLSIIPRFLCVVLIFLSLIIKPNMALAATPLKSTHYATSFFSLADPEQARQLNRVLSDIMRKYPTIKVRFITCMPVTLKGRQYFRSIIVTDQKGRYALAKKELEIANLLKQKVLKLHGMTMQAEPWAYRLKEITPEMIKSKEIEQQVQVKVIAPIATKPKGIKQKVVAPKVTEPDGKAQQVKVIALEEEKPKGIKQKVVAPEVTEPKEEKLEKKAPIVLAPIVITPEEMAPKKITPKGIAPRMVLIPEGFFIMGSEEGYLDERPEYRVHLDAFSLGKYEVTNEEFAAFLNDSGKSTDRGGRTLVDLTGAWKGEQCRIKRHDNSFSVEPGYKKHPVIYVTWYGTQAYCAWLSRKTREKYRLPTEAEWEYAAGGGSKEYKYSWGNGGPKKKKGGNIADERAKGIFPDWTIWNGYADGYVYAAPAGTYRANRFGLHDMTGNVSEWCSDWHGNYPVGIATNPTGPWKGTDRVKRGGSWFNPPYDIRVTRRDHAVPAYSDFSLGFRVARSVKK